MAVKSYQSEIVEFGQKVKDFRGKKKFTQKQLADASGVDVRTLQRIEYGEIPVGIQIILGLAEALEIPAYKLLKGIGQKVK